MNPEPGEASHDKALPNREILFVQRQQYFPHIPASASLLGGMHKPREEVQTKPKKRYRLCATTPKRCEKLHHVPRMQCKLAIHATTITCYFSSPQTPPVHCKLFWDSGCLFVSYKLLFLFLFTWMFVACIF